MFASLLLQLSRLDRRRVFEHFPNSDAYFGLAAYHRAIWTGADHLYAGQLELHQKYFEPLATVWTVITCFVAITHCRLSEQKKRTIAKPSHLKLYWQAPGCNIFLVGTRQSNCRTVADAGARLSDGPGGAAEESQREGKERHENAECEDLDSVAIK